MYQPPPQKRRGSRPCSRSQAMSERTRAAGSPPVGRAWSGAVQCVCRPKGPWRAASCARASHVSSRSASAVAGSGGRMSAAIAKPPGRRACSAAKRRHTASSSGRSTWQETTAYRFAIVCGICGMVTGGAPADVAATARMSEAILHRGPDEHGADAFGRCALGHRRLRVVDLRHGRQPAHDEDGSVHVVFNGEAYNFRALRAELETQGHRIPGHGDTALIPHLYEEHGLGFVERLEGMFALALWDEPRGRLVLARDRLGKKPLLYTTLPDGTFAFASELKALLQLPELPRSLDLAALDAYLALQYVPGTATPLKGVSKLAPGHVLVWESGKVTLERYWQAEARAPEGVSSRDDWLEAVRETVTAAGRERLLADVRVAPLLPGGIGPSVVVALRAAATREPVHTFSVGFADSRYDERLYA